MVFQEIFDEPILFYMRHCEILLFSEISYILDMFTLYQQVVEFFSILSGRLVDCHVMLNAYISINMISFSTGGYFVNLLTHLAIL